MLCGWHGVFAVMELHTSHSYAGRQIYTWIEKMAKLREEDDRVNSNKAHLQNTIKQMSKQHTCAVTLQRVYKKKLAAREAARAGASQQGDMVAYSLCPALHENKLICLA